MGWGYRGGRGRRRESPYAAERREREERTRARVEASKRRFYRLMRQFKRVAIGGELAARAWKLPAVRNFEIGTTSDGSIVGAVLRRDDRDGALYLQEPTFAGWNFYRLYPKHHVLRRGESEEEQRERYRDKRRRR